MAAWVAAAPLIAPVAACVAPMTRRKRAMLRKIARKCLGREESMIQNLGQHGEQSTQKATTTYSAHAQIAHALRAAAYARAHTTPRRGSGSCTGERQFDKSR